MTKKVKGLPTEIKVIVTRDIDGDIAKGSIFHATRVNLNGNDYWTGTMGFMGGSYYVTIPVADCEEYDPRVHDPMYAHWKKTYDDEAAGDKPGELPRRFIEFSIRDLKKEIAEGNSFDDHEFIRERRNRWLKSLEDYYERHYNETRPDSGRRFCRRRCRS